MKVYYNEFDKKKCAALKALMDDGHISKGDIDDRPIQEVMPDDLQGYTRCHFFAGIGLWDYALDLARWEENRRVWTGSCPCQPFSAAGRQRGKRDDRHLWPEWLRLIEKCAPPTIFGEQVNAAVAHGWLDDVYKGLEAQVYAVGSAILPASSVGAPHRRERLWFVGNSELHGCATEQKLRGNEETSNERGEKESQLPRESTGASRPENVHGVQRGESGSKQRHGKIEGDSSRESTMAYSESIDDRRNTREISETNEQQAEKGQREARNAESGSASIVGDTHGPRPQGHRQPRKEFGEEGWETTERHPWSSGEWINCPDGKKRLIEPSIPLLAHGYPERVGVIHSAGDAIVPQVAATFIRSFMEV